MKILFYLGHPAHFHLFKNLFSNLRQRNHEIAITVKSKDILEDLLKESNLDFLNVYPKVRKQGKLSILSALVIKDFRLLKITKSFKPDLMMGTSIEIAQVGKLLNIPTTIVNEDDFDVVPEFARLGYPFTNHIIAPSCCKVGKWSYKKISYEGYHELAYLSPNIFNPDVKVIQKYNLSPYKYSILRFSKLQAYHDSSVSGISKDLAKKIIDKLKKSGKVYITSEQILPLEFEKYRLKINPRNIHHVLHFANLYIGDSQTMAAEAAVLGIPSLRFNDFVGKIGYLEELEHRYSLTFGIKTSHPEALLDKIDELLSIKDIKKLWQERRGKMLSQTVDVNKFLYWFTVNYPKSAELIMNNNGNYSDTLISQNIRFIVN